MHDGRLLWVFDCVRVRFVACVRTFESGCNHMANFGNDELWLKNKHSARETCIHVLSKHTQVTLVVRPSIKMLCITNDQRNQAIGMLNRRIGQERVAQHFHVHQSTVSRLQKRDRATGWVSDHPRPGAQHVMSSRQDRYIVISHLCNRFRIA